MKALSERDGLRISYGAAVLFFVTTTLTSWARWANYEYRTFDLAFYVQGIWQFLHGRFDVSVLGVPLLGNHVEPIVFLLSPFLLVVRHPLVFVALQNAALALMGPVAFRIGRRLGLEVFPALLASVSLLICPAAGYIALHEFHPEALSALFILLMLESRLAGRLGRYWLCFVLVLACKENMAVLLAAYCVVQIVLTRPRKWSELRSWYVWPLLIALVWLALSVGVIGPALNGGGVDYLTLYDRLGNSYPEILRNFLVRPQLAGTSLAHSLAHGSLFWGLLLCFGALPLLRPRWLLISAPILLQHFLSWRESEWTIYFHYAAPILPLFWIAAVEAAARPAPEFWADRRVSLPVLATALLLTASVVGQAILGPFPQMSDELAAYSGKRPARERKDALLAVIPPAASVVAGLPYLSHLAMRERLYSLHFILKGLKPLSHQRYQPPPPTDCVLVDYDDAATFDADAGYYHPAMETKDGAVIPSSDDLLRAFLSRATWASQRSDKLILFTNQSRGMKPSPNK